MPKTPKTTKHESVVLLLSGGLDSVTALYWLRHLNYEVHAMLADYGQQHVQELLFAKAHCHRLGILYTTVELPRLGGLSEQSWIVPNRNAILLHVGANLAVRLGFETVAIGCNSTDDVEFPDCRKAFIESVGASLRAAEIDVGIWAPFILKKKWEIAALARQLGAAFNTGLLFSDGKPPSAVLENK